jgi:hypothetical protein
VRDAIRGDFGLSVARTMLHFYLRTPDETDKLMIGFTGHGVFKVPASPSG